MVPSPVQRLKVMFRSSPVARAFDRFGRRHSPSPPTEAALQSPAAPTTTPELSAVSSEAGLEPVAGDQANRSPLGPAVEPVAFVGLLAALTLAALGQMEFSQSASPSLAGALLYLAGIAVFVSAVIYANRPGRAAQTKVIPLGVIGLLVVTVLSAWLLQRVRQTTPASPWLLLGAWTASIGLYVFSAANLAARRSDNTRLRSGLDRWQVLAVVAVVAAGALLRFWSLETIPGVLSGDEGSQGYEALRVMWGELWDPFTTGWSGVPTLSFFWTVPAIHLFGNTILGLRFAWAVIGALTVPIVFALVHRLHGLTLALITAALLAAYHYHIHFSRLGSNQIADPFFASLALLLLYRAYDHHSLRDWALCGIVVGVAQYGYTGARLTPLLVGAVLFLFLLQEGRGFWRAHRLGILILAGGALVAAAPMLQHAIRHPDDYNARMNAVSIIHSGWLEREQAIRQQGAAAILFDQFQRSALAFNVYPDRTVWYGSPKPLFDSPSGVLFLLGLGYATIRLRDRRLFPFVAWWWGGMIIGGVLTESPPSSQRLITLAAPAVFFVGLALVEIGRLLQRAFRSEGAGWLKPALATAVLALCFLSVKWYFVDFSPQQRAGGPNAMLGTVFGGFARENLGPDWRVYFFGLPRMYYGFGTMLYLAPELEGVDIAEPLTAPPPPDFVQPDKHAAFLFTPERLPELTLLRETFPDGEVNHFYSPAQPDQLLFAVYRVPLPLP